jgi:hypothetical protein
MVARLKLTDLQPRFVRYEVKVEEYEVCTRVGEPHDHGPSCLGKKIGPRVYEPFVDSLADAQGVEFLCPLCFEKNGGPRGTHAVICWSRSRGIPEDAEPGPGRWKLDGTGFHDLTLNGDAPGGGGARSVQLLSGCKWHGFITNGEAHD